MKVYSPVTVVAGTIEIVGGDGRGLLLRRVNQLSGRRGGARCARRRRRRADSRKVAVVSLPQIGAVTTCAHVRSARPVFSK